MQPAERVPALEHLAHGLGGAPARRRSPLADLAVVGQRLGVGAQQVADDQRHAGEEADGQGRLVVQSSARKSSRPMRRRP